MKEAHHPAYRIFFVASCFMEHGGLEERLVTLAAALQGSGHRVLVFSRSPVAGDNQYLARLQACGIRLATPPAMVDALAGDWNTKARLIELLVMVGSPLLAVAALIGAPLQQRSFLAAWCGARGRARNWLGRFLLPDYRDWVLERLLGKHRVLGGAPNLVHIHGYRLNSWPGVIWARRNSLPVVFEEHSSPSEEFETDPPAFTSPYQPDILIAVSQAARNELQKRFIPCPEMVVIPPIIEAVTQNGELRDHLVDNAHRVTISCITRLSPEKGTEYLLQAAHFVKQTHPGASFLIFGDGPLKQALQEQARELDLSDTVSFCGVFSRSELPGIMSRTDILVLPSLTEALGLAIIEGMAYGKPIVASNVGGIPELIEDGVTGLLVPSRNPVLLAQALASLIGDEALRARLGEAARRGFVEGGFTPDAVLGQVLAVYDRAIGKKPGRASGSLHC